MGKEIKKFMDLKNTEEKLENDYSQMELKISRISYGRFNFEEKSYTSIKECFGKMKRSDIHWINIFGVHNSSYPQLVDDLAQIIGLHPLTREDLTFMEHRPKLDDFKDYLYSVLHHLRYDETAECIIEEQISIILGRNFVITFHESHQEIFRAIKEKIRLKKGIVRSQHCDYLFYLLIDAIVDNYFDILEVLEDDVEELEINLVNHPKDRLLQEIHRLKSEFIRLRKYILPLRNVINTLEKAESKLIHKSSTALYFRDIYSHIFQLIDSIELFREMLSGMLNIYLTSVSNKTNDVMKVLTIIATIFMPLTFIVGIYGMNFEFMPELQSKWGYPIVLGVIIVVAVLMVIYFKRKKWW